MTELLVEAGLPKGVINLVTCSRDEAEILLVNPDIKGVSFVGSTAVGMHIYATAAAAGKRVQALTEAKNHALVLRDAVLERSARGIINSACGCAGERCMALPVVVVRGLHRRRARGHAGRRWRKLKIGPAYRPRASSGPVITAEHREFVASGSRRASTRAQRWCSTAAGSASTGYENGFYLGPTIFDHVGADNWAGTTRSSGRCLASSGSRTSRRASP